MKQSTNFLQESVVLAINFWPVSMKQLNIFVARINGVGDQYFASINVTVDQFVASIYNTSDQFVVGIIVYSIKTQSVNMKIRNKAKSTFKARKKH